MPYTAGTADLTVGPRIAAQGIQSAMGGITDMLSKIGMMHLQDQQAGAMMDAYKAAGYFQDQPGKPGSAMLPSALLQAANKGPLGTKSAVSGVINNFLSMQYQMRMAYNKHMMEGGGAVNPQGPVGQQSQGGQRPAPQQQPLYDRQNGPPSTAAGMNLSSPPATQPGGPMSGQAGYTAPSQDDED